MISEKKIAASRKKERAERDNWPEGGKPAEGASYDMWKALLDPANAGTSPKDVARNVAKQRDGDTKK